MHSPVFFFLLFIRCAATAFCDAFFIASIFQITNCCHFCDSSSVLTLWPCPPCCCCRHNQPTTAQRQLWSLSCRILFLLHVPLIFLLFILIPAALYNEAPLCLLGQSVLCIFMANCWEFGIFFDSLAHYGHLDPDKGSLKRRESTRNN